MAKEKIAIVVDSSCGYTKKEAEKMGVHFLSIIVHLGGKEYLDGDTILENDLVNLMNPTSKVSTSAIPPIVFEETFRKALKKADKVLCITLSKKISSI
jgi:fatty acid-binding protein DegV